jgi:hypothetical protein
MPLNFCAQNSNPIPWKLVHLSSGIVGAHWLCCFLWVSRLQYRIIDVRIIILKKDSHCLTYRCARDDTSISSITGYFRISPIRQR